MEAYIIGGVPDICIRLSERLPSDRAPCFLMCMPAACLLLLLLLQENVLVYEPSERDEYVGQPGVVGCLWFHRQAPASGVSSTCVIH